jgi:hypothetical protein
MAVRSENPSSTADMASTMKGISGERISSGLVILCYAFVDGEDRADGEQHDRDHEPVEVPLTAEAERVLLGRRPVGPPAPDQQQHLVAGIGDRVHRLGQHRRGPAHQEGDELDYRDAEVGGERRQHGPHLAPVDPHSRHSIRVRRSRIATVWPGSIPDAMAR